MNTKAQEALKAWREANKGVKVERLDAVQKAKNNPKSLRLALNAMCWECSGGQREEVKLCKVQKCPLFNLRPWQGKDSSDSPEDNED